MEERRVDEPNTEPRPLTAAELYDRAERYPEMTPERARDMIDIIESVSKARNEKQPRLDWLERIAGDAPRKPMDGVDEG